MAGKLERLALRAALAVRGLQPPARRATVTVSFNIIASPHAISFNITACLPLHAAPREQKTSVWRQRRSRRLIA